MEYLCNPVENSRPTIISTILLIFFARTAQNSTVGVGTVGYSVVRTCVCAGVCNRIVRDRYTVYAYICTMIFEWWIHCRKRYKMIDLALRI